jgi:hypothetical protein
VIDAADVIEAGTGGGLDRVARALSSSVFADTMPRRTSPIIGCRNADASGSYVDEWNARRVSSAPARELTRSSVSCAT